MKSEIRVFKTPAELSEILAREIVRRIRAAADIEKPYSIALSGGSTPEILYTFLGDEFSDTVPWDFVQLFWGDERCVPPLSPESNYGMVKTALLDKTGPGQDNIHRINGENDPETEAKRYSELIRAKLPSRDGMPVFDLVLLGMGEDGHTASIFPGMMNLLESEKICSTANHPVTGQTRITLTGRVINNAEAVVFIVTGEKKAAVLRQVINREPGSERYPSLHINPVYGSLDWYLDREAARYL
jgi:6-phosphogluconolactonase